MDAFREVLCTMRDDVGKVAASTCLMLLSWIVLYQSCLRASTIYFFELDTTTVWFVNRLPAILFPFFLSAVLYLVYLGTKRSTEISEERILAQEKEKELRNASVLNSRFVSRETSRRPSISIIEESNEQQQRIRRLLSDIEEQDIESTIHSHRLRLIRRAEDAIEESSVFNDTIDDESSKLDGEGDSFKEKMQDEDEKDEIETTPPRKLTRSRFVVENVEDGEKIIIPPAVQEIRRTLDSPFRSRTNSKSVFDSISRKESISGTPRMSTMMTTTISQRSSRKSSISMDQGKIVSVSSMDDDEPQCDIYKRLGDIDLFSFSLSALSLIPRTEQGPRVYLKLDMLDIVAEFCAVHVPIWACVACLHVILLEVFNMHLSYYFYYHEESMVYAALVISFLFGLLHELSGNWISNDVLAFASIYVVCSRIQAISYQTAVVFVLGMVLFDLFFLYVVDLLSTVVSENRAPLMIMIPRDKNGNKQSLATLDIMVPGIFLNVVLKYSAMYDTRLFMLTFGAVFASLVLTMLVSIWRSKITPAMVLPAFVAIGVSLGCAAHPADLWRFMIKQK